MSPKAKPGDLLIPNKHAPRASEIGLVMEVITVRREKYYRILWPQGVEKNHSECIDDCYETG